MEVFEAGKVKPEISNRELKHKTGDIVKVYKLVNGEKVHTANCNYIDIEEMHNLYTQEEIDILANANLLVRCQNLARNWNKAKADPLDRLIKSKGYDEATATRIKAFLLKLDSKQ